MTSSKVLALIGIGLYILRVFASGTDANGNSVAPDALILVSGTASLVYVIVAGMALWKRGAKRTAWALPLTFLFAFAPILLTPNPSGLNLLLNALNVIAFLTYLYAVYLLFTSVQKGLASSGQ